MSSQRAVLAGILVAFLMYQSAQAGEMYRWTDANGDIHLSETPPPGHVEPKTSNMQRDGQKDYLEYMETYDRRWKAASPAERTVLDLERKRLAKEASAALQDRSKYSVNSMPSGSQQDYESLGSRELRQARWAMIQAQVDPRKARTADELERAIAEHKQLQDRYLKILSRTSNEDQSQADRIEQGYWKSR